MRSNITPHSSPCEGKKDRSRARLVSFRSRSPGITHRDIVRDMATRATRQIFWWHLSCIVTALERTDTVSIVPIFPGEVVYFLVDAGANYSSVSEEENRTRSDDRRAIGPRNRRSRGKCATALLAIRMITLIVAIVFLIFHWRLCIYASGSHNRTMGGTK